jgi:hypothetical protein
VAGRSNDENGGSGDAGAAGVGGVAAASGAAGTAGATEGGSGGRGGSSAAAGSPGSAGTAAGGVPGGLTLELIDDMEDGDASIDYGPGNRNGNWYVGHDATAGGTQFPGADFVMSALPKTDSRYPVSKFAAMTKGLGFNDWGENMGFNMLLVDPALGKHPPYDASAYCGLHFFGKVAVGADSQVILRVPDKNSHPDGGVCGSAAKPCYFYFQKLYDFGTDWTEYAVLFTDLERTGWPASFVVSAIYGVEFGLQPKTEFDLWVDDISFLKKPASGLCPTTL